MVLLVFVTSRVAEEVDHPVVDSWRYIGRPFLIGTVAMGGAVNILPVVFAKVRFRRREVIIFTWVVIGALFFVWVLNVLWCYFLLKTIPQTAEGAEEDKNNVLTLEGAERYGKPSTVPLVSTPIVSIFSSLSNIPMFPRYYSGEVSTIHMGRLHRRHFHHDFNFG